MVARSTLGVQMAQEPPEPHCCWTHHSGMRVWKAMEQLSQSSCLRQFSFSIHKKGTFPFPCQGLGSFFPKMNNQTGYKIPRFLYADICHSATAPAPPPVLITERFHRQSYISNNLFTRTLSSDPIWWGLDYWTLQAHAPAGLPAHSVWVEKQIQKSIAFNPEF